MRTNRMHFIKIITIFFLLAPVYACHFNSTFLNREKDKDDASKVVDSFYKAIGDNNFKDVDKIMGDSFLKYTPIDTLRQTILHVNQEYGNVKSFSIINWQTRVMEGTDSRADYLLLYDVTRDKKHTQESFTLTKEGNKVKITNYHISYTIE